MDFLSLATVVLRRWWVVLPVLALTGLVAYQMWTDIEVVYEAKGTALLTHGGTADPTDDIAVPPRGPIIAEVVQGGEERDRIAEQGATGAYTVRWDGGQSILRVTATAQRASMAARTADAVMEAIEDQTRRREESLGLPPAASARLERLAEPRLARRAEGGFQASGSILFIPAKDGNPLGANPYTVELLGQTMGGAEAREEVAALGSQSAYAVSSDRRNVAPLISVTATGTDPQDVFETYGDVVTVMAEKLDERQANAGVAPVDRASVTPLVPPSSVVRASGNLMRPVLTVIGLGLIAALAFAVLVEGIIVRRRNNVPQTTSATLADRRGGDGRTRQGGPKRLESKRRRKAERVPRAEPSPFEAREG